MLTLLILLILLTLCGSSLLYAQDPCFPGKLVTAAKATGGSSPYLDDVLWLTWGGKDKNNPYGIPNKAIIVNDASYASIPLGGDNYLCIEAVVTKIEGDSVESYRPGDYQYDRLDDLYNIGGTDKKNKLIAGIRNKKDGTESTITLRCKATINGEPVRLAGMVIADGESLGGQMASNGSTNSEIIYATGKGSWNVVNVDRSKKSDAKLTYYIRKEYRGAEHTVKFMGGGDNQVSASAFLSFNDDAYDHNNSEAVEFRARLKGGGKTAMAIGIIPPHMDVGDAPASYGKARHLLQGLTFSSDGIKEIPSSSSPSQKFRASVDVNSTKYKPAMMKHEAAKYLGSVPPDNDLDTLASRNADDDDLNYPLNDEDAWPANLKRVSHKLIDRGKTFEVVVPYKKAIAGDRISGWIDFNLNGKFDESERVTAEIPAAGDGHVTLTWTVPDERVIRNTYVRLRYFDKVQDYKSPTATVFFGEAEDHKIYVLGQARTNPALPSRSKRL